MVHPRVGCPGEEKGAQAGEGRAGEVRQRSPSEIWELEILAEMIQCILSNLRNII